MAELKGANAFEDEVIKFIKITNADQLMLQVLEMSLNSVIPQMEEENPDFPTKEYLERFKQKIDANYFMYQTIPIYSKYYTKEEISELVAFYETPIGRKLTNASPQIVQGMMEANQIWVNELIAMMEKDFDSIS